MSYRDCNMLAMMSSHDVLTIGVQLWQELRREFFHCLSGQEIIVCSTPSNRDEWDAMFRCDMLIRQLILQTEY